MAKTTSTTNTEIAKLTASVAATTKSVSNLTAQVASWGKISDNTWQQGEIYEIPNYITTPNNPIPWRTPFAPKIPSPWDNNNTWPNTSIEINKLQNEIFDLQIELNKALEALKEAEQGLEDQVLENHELQLDEESARVITAERLQEALEDYAKKIITLKQFKEIIQEIVNSL